MAATATATELPSSPGRQGGRQRIGNLWDGIEMYAALLVRLLGARVEGRG